MKELELLQTKLSVLIKQFQNLKLEAEKLNKKVTAQQLTIDEQTKTIALLEEKIKEKIFAQNLTSDTENKETLKEYIEEIIRKIDDNIKLLQY